MNSTFYMFHHGQALSALERACMTSFIRSGHNLVLFSYDKYDVPPGVKCKDARSILPKEQLFYFDESPSAFSNIFRYKLLLENGGWWVDTDVMCLSSSIPSCEYAWSYEDPKKINGAILRFPRGDSLASELLSDSIARAQNLSKWGQLGPLLLTEKLEGKHYHQHLGDTASFYPVHWMETHLFWLPDKADIVRSRLKGALFLHLWNSIFYKMGLNPTRRPPNGSFLAEILSDCLTDLQPDNLSMDERVANVKAWLDRRPNFPRFYESVLGRDWMDIQP